MSVNSRQRNERPGGEYRSMAADSTSKLPLGTPTGPLRAQPKPRITDVPHRIESRRQCPGAPASATAPTHDAHYFQQPSGLHLRPARAPPPRARRASITRRPAQSKRHRRRAPGASGIAALHTRGGERATARTGHRGPIRAPAGDAASVPPDLHRGWQRHVVTGALSSIARALLKRAGQSTS